MNRAERAFILKITLAVFFTFLCGQRISAQQVANEEGGCKLIVEHLKCEQLSSPMGLEVQQPRLSWILQTPCANHNQHAYRITVGTSVSKYNCITNLVWDSGELAYDVNKQIVYEGEPLEAFTTYYWSVQVRDENGLHSAAAPIAEWTTGYLEQKIPTAQWISSSKTESAPRERNSAHYFFKDMDLDKEIKSAKILVSGLGWFELYLNAEKVGNHVLDPADTDYSKRATYVVFDALPYLKEGNNQMGVLLGNGKHYLGMDNYVSYGLPKLWLELHIRYKTGKEKIIKTDASWKWTAQGPILYNNEFKGETYDNRIPMPYHLPSSELRKLGFAVRLVSDYQPALYPQLQEARKVIEERSAIKITEPEPNVYVFDFGQNMVGWGKLTLKGREGQTISMRFAELLHPDGRIDTASLRDALATDRYILGTDTLEIYSPRFTYHGFRYVCVRGLTKRPDTSVLKACVIHSDLVRTGTFSSSNELLNKIYNNVIWTLKGNYQSLPLDCPQRDERMGWLGDRAATINGEAFVFDVYAIYSKWARDIRYAQNVKHGGIPNIAPEYWVQWRNNVTWPAAYPYVVDRLYRQYGAAKLIKEHYEPIKKWLAFLEERYSDNGILYADQYGDWSIPPIRVTDYDNKDPRLKSSADILATSSYLRVLSIMKNWAKYLGKETDRQVFEEKYALSRKKLYQDFMDHSLENYGNNTPTELILLLSNPHLQTAQEDSLIYNLEGKLRGQYNERLVFGLVGMRHLLITLSEAGKLDLAYQLATQTTYPSLGYMLEQGATTLWEHWNGDPKGSHNHIMLSGDLLEWYYSYLGGIQLGTKGLYEKNYQPYNHFVMHPHIPNDLTSVEVNYQSPKGNIRSAWMQKKSSISPYTHLSWHVEIPVGARAELRIPCADFVVDSLFVNGQQLKMAALESLESGDYVKDSRKGNYQVVYIGSGKYEIETLYLKKREEPTSQSPLISPQDTLVKKGEDVWVKFEQADEKAKVYYTLDGSDPTIRSKRYRKPIKLDTYTVVKAISVEKRKKKSFIKNSVIDFYNPQQNGWRFDYYEQSLSKLPNFDTLSINHQGHTSQLDVYRIRRRMHAWAICFYSNLEIPRDDVYTFYLACDDGAALLIDGQKVLQNDYIHYKTQRTKSVFLKQGIHPLKIEYFNAYSIAGLELGISAPGMPRQNIPLSFLKIP